MGKKKQKKEIQKPRVQNSFKELVSEASLNKLKPFIQMQMQQLGMQLMQEQQGTLRLLFTRLTVVEQILMDKLNITQEEMAEKVADAEDEGLGLIKHNDEVKAGDTIRIEVATKTKEQEEFQGESKLTLDNVGVEPYNLGPEIEPKIVGMKFEQESEIEFGKDNEMTAKIKVCRISRKPEIKKEESKAPEKSDDIK